MNPMPAVRTGLCALVLHYSIGTVHAQDPAIAGEYMCVSGGTCPCDGDNKLKLALNGSWRLGPHGGTYRANDQKLEFDGAGGAATWGPATISKGTLTFNTGTAPVVCFQPGKSEPPR